MKNPRIEIREIGTGKVVRVIPIENATAQKVEKALMGLLRHMDTARFVAAEVDCP